MPSGAVLCFDVGSPFSRPPDARLDAAAALAPA
jgi:hypothetical protein